MCNKYDYRWRDVKKRIALKNKEITLIWNISYNKRRLLYNDGIYKYTEIKNYKNELIQNMININIKDDGKLMNRFNNIRISEEYKNHKKLYIDFETTILYDKIDTQYLYMIGIGYYEKNKWIFHNLITNKLDDINEKKNN